MDDTGAPACLRETIRVSAFDAAAERFVRGSCNGTSRRADPDESTDRTTLLSDVAAGVPVAPEIPAASGTGKSISKADRRLLRGISTLLRARHATL
jgi:hypothetical protein